MRDYIEPFVLGLVGSPIRESNTDILVQKVLHGSQDGGARVQIVYLNDLDILPCQACGESPGPRLCFFEDDMTPLYEKIVECDGLVIGSPVYFDSVSAQTKLFVDRMNCVRPLARIRTGSGKQNLGFKLNPVFRKKRKAAYILVGGDRQKYEAARRVLKGLYIWANMELVGELTYAYGDWDQGKVKTNKRILSEAYQLGQRLLS